ncbi:hypothetical protein CHS0354_030609 [Potamilus streckersoni]|uniref:Carbohydrate sulfotransferase n=1 Tax=Potamilus streckersoni TaxID=2493646 RepID=A0AAE0VTI0_9BIVA|nr:hypothetical protein CHS0354_030609 [Potamilus streckersoni]
MATIIDIMKLKRAFFIVLVSAVSVTLFCYIVHFNSTHAHTRFQPGNNEQVQNLRSELDVDLFSYHDNLHQSQQLKESQLSVADEQKKRLEVLKQGCEKLQADGLVANMPSHKAQSHIIVNDQYKVLYCYIPKVACTNLKRMFLILTGKMNTSNLLSIKSGDVHFTFDKYFTYLDNYSQQEADRRIQSYRKVIFVREPLERLLSAYRNKFLQNSTYFHQRFGKKIVRQFRILPSKQSIETGSDVKFDEFIKYIMDPETRNQYNEHWDKFTSLCDPCTIPYDFIGKYETFNNDIQSLLEMLGVAGRVEFPKRSDNYKTTKTKDSLIEFYRQVPKHLLSQMWNVYYSDYLLFDYPYPEVLKALKDDIHI